MRRTSLPRRALAPVAGLVLATSLLGGCGNDEPEATDVGVEQGEDVEDTGEEPVEEGIGEDDANEGAPPDVSGACQEALVAAAAAQDIGPVEEEGAVGPLGEEDEAEAEAGEEVPGGEFEVSPLFPAFDACATVGEFAAALEDSPQALLGSDTNEPDEFVRLTCEEELAVQDSPLCLSVE